MNILITGGLGYIGSSLTNFLSNLGYNVTVIDNLYTQRYCSLFNRTHRFGFIENDFINLSKEFLEQFDYVVHCAAIVDATNSKNQIELIEKINVYQTIEFLYRCNRAGLKIIFPSSTSVYGTSSKIVCEDDQSILKPQSPYAEAKILVENAIQKLNCVILRFGTVCGVSPGIRFQTCINKLCYQAAFNQPLTIWKENLNLVRPYLSLSDLRATIFEILNNWNYLSRQTYNVLTNNHTLNEIIYKIQKYEPYLKINYTDCPLLNQYSYEVSTEKIQKFGIRFLGNINEDICETFILLRIKNEIS